MKKIYLAMMLVAAISCITYAGSVVLVKEGINYILKPTEQSKANASCFMYGKTDFKCTCRFSDNSIIWASKELNQFNNQLSNDTRYGYIETCNKVQHY